MIKHHRPNEKRSKSRTRRRRATNIGRLLLRTTSVGKTFHSGTDKHKKDDKWRYVDEDGNWRLWGTRWVRDDLTDKGLGNTDNNWGGPSPLYNCHMSVRRWKRRRQANVGRLTVFSESEPWRLRIEESAQLQLFQLSKSTGRCTTPDCTGVQSNRGRIKAK